MGVVSRRHIGAGFFSQTPKSRWAIAQLEAGGLGMPGLVLTLDLCIATYERHQHGYGVGKTMPSKANYIGAGARHQTWALGKFKDSPDPDPKKQGKAKPARAKQTSQMRSLNSSVETLWPVLRPRRRSGGQRNHAVRMQRKVSVSSVAPGFSRFEATKTLGQRAGFKFQVCSCAASPPRAERLA